MVDVSQLDPKKVTFIEKDADKDGVIVIAQALTSAEGVIRELLRTTASNPIMALGTMLLLSEIFYKLQLIDKNKRDKIDILIGTLVGIDFTLEAITDIIKSIKPTALSDATKGGLLQPSATTLVYGQDQTSLTASILNKVNK